MSLSVDTAPVCCRCVKALGETFITVHRKEDGQAVAVCHDCATPQERRAHGERKAKGVGW